MVRLLHLASEHESLGLHHLDPGLSLGKELLRLILHAAESPELELLLGGQLLVLLYLGLYLGLVLTILRSSF